MSTTVDCRFCIDGFMPAGTDPDIGALYERCPACTPACSGCDGIAVFPAATHCVVCFLESLLAKRLGAIFCPRCQGVITLIDLDQQATP
jgi:hypothetical protein